MRPQKIPGKAAQTWSLKMLNRIRMFPQNLALGMKTHTRYEKKSIIVTSNKMPGEWGTVFGDAAAATASLDRLLHHCTPMLIQGERYRTRKFSRKMRE